MADKLIAPLLLDVSRLVWRAWRGRLPTGIDRTCLAYVAHYQNRAVAVIQRGSVTRLLSPSTSRQLFDVLLQGANVRSRLLKLIPASLMDITRSSTLAGCHYLNVGHTGLEKVGHSQWIERTGVKPIYFVHDLIPLVHPEYCRPEEPEKHQRRMTALLTHAAGVIANSCDTLNELAVFAARQRSLQMPSALAAPLGVTIVSDRRSEVPLGLLRGGPYFLMVGTVEGRKNHLLILNVWVELARRLGAACPKLVIIGQRGWECEQAVDMLERCEAIRGHVIELSRCDDVQLIGYLRGARALLFPSFAEGYGLPLVEALSHGTPVIASDLPVFRELAGVIPDYLSPIDGLGWASMIENYTRDDSPMRHSQYERMANWAPPSWQNHFAQVDRWLERFNFTPRQKIGLHG